MRSAVCTHFADGGEEPPNWPKPVAEAAEEPSEFRLLYPSEASLKEKIEALATKVYGADGVDYSATADRQLANYEKNGFGDLPICIAKTQYSISSDPNLKGAPTGWRLPVREVRASVGAGFIYPICGEMSTMPRIRIRPCGLRDRHRRERGDRRPLLSPAPREVPAGRTPTSPSSSSPRRLQPRAPLRGAARELR